MPPESATPSPLRALLRLFIVIIGVPSRFRRRMNLHLTDLKSIARFVVRRFREDALAQVAGSLTFTTLFALVPLVTIVITMFTVLPVSTKLASTLNAFIVSNFLPGAASKLISGYTQQFAENATRLTAIGVALLAVTAIMMMSTIDRAFNRIWRVHRSPPIMRRMLVYWALLTVGPLLVAAAVYFAFWLISASLGMIDERGSRRTILKILSVMLTFVALLFLYRTVPNRRVSWSDAMAGALIGGAGFEAMKALFTAVVATFGNYKLIYGAFAGFPVFLSWVFLSWLIVLTGAVITAALPQLRTGAWARYRVPGGNYLEALAILRHLRHRHASGGVSSLEELSRAARMTWEDTEVLLVRMATRGWAVRGGEGGWVLCQDPRNIKLETVFEEFVFQSEGLSREANRLGLDDRPWQAAPAVTGRMNLEQWCADGAAGASAGTPLSTTTADESRSRAELKAVP